MLALIYNAKDLGVAKSFDCTELENEHFMLWKSAKERYVAESEQSIRFKLSGLVSSQQPLQITSPPYFFHEFVSQACHIRFRRIRTFSVTN